MVPWTPAWTDHDRLMRDVNETLLQLRNGPSPMAAPLSHPSVCSECGATLQPTLHSLRGVLRGVSKYMCPNRGQDWHETVDGEEPLPGQSKGDREFESVDRVVREPSEEQDASGALVFDCPDCPTQITTGARMYGAVTCGDCLSESRGELSLEELRERKANEGGAEV